jgi:phospholipid-translocating ATPase
VEAAFQALKGTFFAASILADPQPGERFIVDTDASNFGIGGVLSQIQDGEEQNYCVTKRDLFAMVRTLEHFHSYLYGQQFHLRTDHSSLTWLMEGQTARWIQRLQEYNFTSENRQSRKHKNADTLSRPT